MTQGSQEAISRLLRNITYTDREDFINQVIELLDPLFSASTDAAAVYSARMYDEIRDYEIGSELPTTPRSRRDVSATNNYLRMIAARIEQDGIERLIEKIKRRMTYEIKKAAGESIAYNAAHDPAKPKYARVPTGDETCEWCIMLASRGYVYESAKSAGALRHWHEHCDCVIIPQFDPSFDVRGYDPKYYESIWYSNVVYDEYGHVNTDATLKNIRAWTNRDQGYYEAHKAERHAYYEQVVKPQRTSGE